MSTERKRTPGSFANEFVCKLKFRNDIPKCSIEPKLLKIPIDLAKYSAFRLLSDEQQFVVEEAKYSKIDIFAACPSDIIYNSIGEVANVKRENEPLDPVDEQLCTDGFRTTPSVSGKTSPAMNGGMISSLGIPANIPGSNGSEIETENDLINAIAETFEPCDEYIHPTNPSLTATKVFDLVPDRKETNLVQCNFDSAIQHRSSGDVMLRIAAHDSERYFDCFTRIAPDSEEFKFIREYNYHGYAEEGNTLMLSMVPQQDLALYSFVNTKVNLRKKRGTLVEARDKSGDTLVVERK